MHEAWIIISDAGVAPDWRGEWPKLAVAHVKSEHQFGMLTLGLSRFFTSNKKKLESVLCEIQYFNDGDNALFPDSLGTIAKLEVNSLYGKTGPIQLICDHITKAEFETHLAFDTLPELPVIPYVSKFKNK